MMTAIRRGLESAMAVAESRPLARGKLVDLGLIVGAAVLVLVTVGLNLLGNLVQRASGSLSEAIGLGSGTLASVLLHGTRFLLSVAVVLLLYRFVPARRLRTRDGLAGAIVTALLFLLISLASGWISEKTARLSVIYGSLTTSLVFLYSVYLYSSALLLGAEVAAAWSRPQTANGEPILSQAKRAVLGLFVRQKESPVDEPMPEANADEASGPRSAPPSH
jgi:YihY family inner membrane protein